MNNSELHNFLYKYSREQITLKYIKKKTQVKQTTKFDNKKIENNFLVKFYKFQLEPKF